MSTLSDACQKKKGRTDFEFLDYELRNKFIRTKMPIAQICIILKRTPYGKRYLYVRVDLQKKPTPNVHYERPKSRTVLDKPTEEATQRDATLWRH